MSYSGQAGVEVPAMSGGMIGLIDLIQLLSNIQATLNEINATLGNSYIAMGGANTFTGNNTYQGTSLFSGATTFSKPIQLPKYAVAALPAVTSANEGEMAFATNCRNTGQGSGAGTGALVVVDNTGAWAAVWSGVAPTV